MSDQRDAKREWIERVLGFTFPDARQEPGTNAAGAAARWKIALDRWKAASEAVDGQIGALQAVLLRSDDDELKQIAEYGLNGVTGNNRVPLQAALIEAGAGDPPAMCKVGPKALGIIKGFRTYLDTSEQVAVCDENPFDTPVSIRTTLGGALAEMATALEASLGG